MARATQSLIEALRQSAERIATGNRYEWGHVGRCNCGHLVQTISQKTDAEIIRSFGPQLDEWTEHANDYCTTTGSPIEDLFSDLEAVGFYREDVRHLEYLSDRRVLKRLPVDRRHLKRNRRDDVVLYMNTMAGLLEEQLT